MPARLAALLHTVRLMLGFGRHLAETAPQRAAGPGFNPIAACFGTSRLYAVMAHLQRGILRATALENVLRRWAAEGRDFVFAEPPQSAAAQPAAGDPPPAQPAEVPTARKRARAHRGGSDDPELFMPSLQELEAQIRRRPIGRTLVDICLDLAVVPGFCTGAYWNLLSETISAYGGSVVTLLQEKRRREEAFSREQDRKPLANWDWVELTRDATRRLLGRFVGEPADAPFDPESQSFPLPAALATGPP